MGDIWDSGPCDWHKIRLSWAQENFIVDLETVVLAEKKTWTGEIFNFLNGTVGIFSLLFGL